MEATMKKIAICIVLVTAFLSLHPAAGIVILKDGETYQQKCTLTTSGDTDLIIQFMKEKSVIKMFNSKYTIAGRVISNGTELDPVIANRTDRYTVFKESGRIGSLVLRITDVRPSDSGHYLCRVFDPNSGIVVTSEESEELLIRGPLKDLYWTRNHSGLNRDRSFEVPDNGTVLEPNLGYGPLTACVILVSNVEPTVNITIGKPGEEGTEDITDKFEIRSATEKYLEDITDGFNVNLFFVKRSKFQQASIRDLYCSASQPGSVSLNRSVNLEIIISPPRSRQCEPFEFKAPVGSNNVTLHCLIPAHPAPNVTWNFGRKGIFVNETSNNPMFSVKNQYMFEGLLTTLTITNVMADSFGRYDIDATNSEGSGRMYLHLMQGQVNGAGMRDLSLFLMLLGLLTVWMFKA